MSSFECLTNSIDMALQSVLAFFECRARRRVVLVAGAA